MKTLLFIPFLFMCSVVIGQSSKIIGKPIKIGKLMFAQYDFPHEIFSGPKEMTWDDAKKACADLGSGWRLPTKNELNLMYLNKDKIGGFSRSFYWSSTEIDNDYAWGQNFSKGLQSYGMKGYGAIVRAVRAF